MLERLKTKFAEVKQWVSTRFNLDTKLGMVKADIELSAMVIGRKIGETVKSVATDVKQDFEEFCDNPKQYLKDNWEEWKERFEHGKEVVSKKIEAIKDNLKSDKQIETSFTDRLAGWFNNRAKDIYEVSEKITKARELWEVYKVDAAINVKKDKKLALLILERVEKLNNKREEYKAKAKKQTIIGLQLQNAY